MDTDHANIETVRSVYKRFAEHDIAGVVELLSDAVAWLSPGPSAIPWAGIRHGKAEVAKLLEIYATAVIVDEFAPNLFLSGPDTVAAVGHGRMTAVNTHKYFETDFVHVFTLRNAEILAVREFYDTAVMAAAFSS